MAQIFVSAVAHFFVAVGGSKFHDRLAHFFIDIYNQLAEQLRSAKQRKEQLQKRDDDETITQTQNLIETLDAGPEFLDSFDEELFCELIDKIIIDSNTKIRFRLKNGLELPESIERTVR